MTAPEAPVDGAVAVKAEEDPPQPSSRWVAAASEVRGSVKWLVGGLATGVGLVFGAGPLISNETDSSGWAPSHWVIVLASAAAAALCAGGLIRRLLHSVRPVELTLDRLPSELLARIKGRPEDYLPSGADSLKSFRNRRQAYARSAATLASLLAQAEGDAADPPTEAEKKNIAELKHDCETQSANYELYEKTKIELFEQGKFIVESSNVDRLTDKRAARLLVGLIVSAVVFTFGTHTPADPDEGDSPQPSEAPVSPQGASIRPVTGSNASNSRAFWDQLGLDACQVGDSVPVLLLEVSGEDVLQYKLQTLGEPSGCTRYAFQASEHLVALTVPEPTEVDLTEDTEDEKDHASTLKKSWDWFIGA